MSTGQTPDYWWLLELGIFIPCGGPMVVSLTDMMTILSVTAVLAS